MAKPVRRTRVPARKPQSLPLAHHTPQAAHTERSGPPGLSKEGAPPRSPCPWPSLSAGGMLAEHVRGGGCRGSPPRYLTLRTGFPSFPLCPPPSMTPHRARTGLCESSDSCLQRAERTPKHAASPSGFLKSRLLPGMLFPPLPASSLLCRPPRLLSSLQPHSSVPPELFPATGP